MCTEEKLAEMQKEVDKLYEENDYKLNDEILDKQVEINQLRNEYNIPDESEFIFEDFAQ